MTDTNNFTSAFPTYSSEPYRCPRCQRWYLQGNMSCCVMHYNECCHLYDKEVPEPEWFRAQTP